MAAILLAGWALLTAADDRAHLGVASCATGVCHGKLTPSDESNVLLNEYRTWSAEDRHARAYQTLMTQESKSIAIKLGLASAHTAAICLDCHADHVPASMRGPKFQINDGVGCEACHGGAAEWIESHTETTATHADNLAKGLVATEDPVRRADLCLGCHLGTSTKFATHQIMGAGHPRLSFELEAFTANQPAHYDVDADYRERKGEIAGFNMWLIGQVAAARRYLDLLESDHFGGVGPFPDYSFFDCHGCHHPMDDVRWPDRRRKQGLTPGVPRLQDQNLLMLQAALAVVSSGELETLRDATRALLVAGQSDFARLRSAAATLADWLDAKGAAWATRSFSGTTVRGVRRAVLNLAARGELWDFAAAEQSFLAVESLSLAIGDTDAHGAALDTLFDAVESDETYRPEQYRRAAASVLAEF